MPTDWDYDLHIHGTTPKRLSLEELGELAKRFADLLGSSRHVHFKGLKQGSASLRVRVDEEARAAVIGAIFTASSSDHDNPKFRKLDDYLAQKGWHGEVREGANGVVLVRLPGASNDEIYDEANGTRTVRQVSSVVGSIVRIGGRDETVPMQLRLTTGEYFDATVRGRDTARKLGHYLLGEDLRFTGLTTWERSPDGQWECLGMVVDEFEALDAQPLTSLFDDLARIPGNGWTAFDDPDNELSKLRGADE